MKIKLLVARASATGAENRGDVIDVSADEAGRMVEAGEAEFLRTVEPEKTASKKRTEKARK